MRPSTHRFTLVEVILAVALLAVGMVGVLAAYTKSADTLRIAQENIDAYRLLKQRMSQVELQTLAVERLPYGTNRGAFTGPFRYYIWEVEIEPGPAETVDAVTVEVTNTHSDRSYSLTHYAERKPAAEEEAQ